MGEQATLELDKPFGDVLLHKLVKTYKFNMLGHTLCITSQTKYQQIGVPPKHSPPRRIRHS